MGWSVMSFVLHPIPLTISLSINWHFLFFFFKNIVVAWLIIQVKSPDWRWWDLNYPKASIRNEFMCGYKCYAYKYVSAKFLTKSKRLTQHIEHELHINGSSFFFYPFNEGGGSRPISWWPKARFKILELSSVFIDG